MKKNLLEVNNLTYEVGDNKIIDKLNFSVEEGSLTVITGPNGGGKTSLAKLIMGLEQPNSGEIFFNNENITEFSISDRAKKGISYAFQQPPRIKGLTVRELLSIASGEELHEDRCCQYLTQVGLCSSDYLYRDIDSSLSGGEMKRIEIASVLARNPKLAIFDEPEAGIDLWSFSRLTETFRELYEKHLSTLVIISHQERILDIADRIVLVANGKVQEEGSKNMLYGKIISEANKKGCGMIKGDM